MSNSQGLINGGGAALFWGYIWTFVGYGFIAASLADMASMAPVCTSESHSWLHVLTFPVDRWRTVSLDIRVRTQEVPAPPLLLLRLACGSFLASG